MQQTVWTLLLLHLLSNVATEVSEDIHIGTFWHIADFHYDANYSEQQSTESLCHKWPQQGSSEKNNGEFGNYDCDSPWTLVVSAINAMKLLHPDPDFLIWTGDSVPHEPDEQLSPPKVYTLIQNVTSKLTEVFPQAPLFPVLGNHDSWPANQLPGTAKDYYDNILYACGWDGVLTPGAAETFHVGGFYSMKTPSGQRLLGLNTNVYSTADSSTEGQADPNLQLAWLEQQLTQAQDNGERVYIVGHIPPGYAARATDVTWFREENSEAFVGLLRRHSKCIVACFFGHEHTDNFRMIYSEEGHPAVILFMAPAVTPWKNPDPAVGPNNPSIRLFKFDRDTGNILDYQQYFLNLSAANAVGEAHWLLEYEAKSTYQLEDFSPSQLNELAREFGKSESELFDSYYRYNSVSYELSKCTGQCKVGQICAMTNVSQEVYHLCLKNEARMGHSSHFPADMMHHYVNPLEPKPEIVSSDKTPVFMYFIIAGVVILCCVLMLTIAVMCSTRRPVTNYFSQPGYMPIKA